MKTHHTSHPGGSRLARLRRPVVLAATIGAFGLLAGTTAVGQASPAPGVTVGCAHAHQVGATRAGRFAGIVRPVAAAAVCGVSPWDAHNSGGTPPLINHGGPMMGTRASHDKVVVTPIFWAGSGYGFTASYKRVITHYLQDAAADSEQITNVFSTLFEYGGSNGTINYSLKVGKAINDTTAFPAAGCTTNSGAVYGDSTGYTTCLDDAQVTAEIDAQVGLRSLPRDLGHIYVVFLPKHAESCFDAGNPHGQACTINPSPSTAYCAYHSEFGGDTVYANLPFPVYQSATGFSCTAESLGGGGSTIQAPNGDPDADVEVSPLSHEMSEAITDPDTASGWFDSSGFENGDECAYIYGALSGTNGGFYNQVVNGRHYLTQDEFSNADFAATGGGCLQHYQPIRPVVSSLSPHAGSTSGGTTVTINGQGFAGVTAVRFGTTSAAFTLVDGGRIKATAPAHAAGTVDVTVIDSVGTSAIKSADHYTYS